ncbi:hypothetical protein ACMXYX_17785 (plasmid) [Neptuniibacter sp. QD72_48]|uniref:hypothetical protein n=1 Tax=Neptuniibacter sp. QD72_48 TaxID=3398214 RepID=UPI0039F5C9EC
MTPLTDSEKQVLDKHLAKPESERYKGTPLAEAREQAKAQALKEYREEKRNQL